MISGRLKRLVGTGLAVALAATLVTSAWADDGGGFMPTSHPFLLGNLIGTSQNWAGWAAYAGLAGLAQPGAVSYVKGEWVVPAVSCGSTDAASSVWVGIDGVYNGVVEQAGTEQTCTGGVATYAAWWEMYPAPKTPANLAIKPGDSVRAEVTYVGGGQFVLALTNLTTGGSFRTTQTSFVAPRQTAEWVVEAPWSGGVLPLANFGRTSIVNGRATINGKTGSIASAGLLSALNLQGETMADLHGLIKATVTNPALSGGDSFTATWMHS